MELSTKKAVATNEKCGVPLSNLVAKPNRLDELPRQRVIPFGERHSRSSSARDDGALFRSDQVLVVARNWLEKGGSLRAAPQKN